MKLFVPFFFIMYLAVSFPAQAQTIIRGPYLQTATSKSIIIRWRTNTATASRVNYGTAPAGLNFRKDDSTITTEHIVKLSGLTVHTKYYYSVANLNMVLDADTGNHFYTLPTAGASSGTYRIGVFGDCGNNSVNQRSVRDAFLKYAGNNNIDSWLLLGDNAYSNGTDAQYQAGFFNIYRRTLLRNSPLWPATGNHDYDNTRARQIDKDIAYFKIFSVPENGEAGGLPSHSNEYYSFDIGNVHLVALDSYAIDSATRLSDTTGPQARWLKQDLATNQNRDWIIVFFSPSAIYAWLSQFRYGTGADKVAKKPVTDFRKVWCRCCAGRPQPCV